MKYSERWLDWAAELQSLAQAGLYYGKDVYDRERYERIRHISAEIMAEYTDVPVEKVKDIFTHYRKTHNDGVFDAYTEEIRLFRSLGFLTGLPDNYARGRIIGDYRR